MQLGRIQSRIVNHPQLSEVGFFEVDVEVDDEVFRKSGDKRGLVIKTIARHAAEQMFITGLPAEYWTFYPEEEVSRALSIPAALPFAGV